MPRGKAFENSAGEGALSGTSLAQLQGGGGESHVGGSHVVLLFVHARNFSTQRRERRGGFSTLGIQSGFERTQSRDDGTAAARRVRSEHRVRSALRTRHRSFRASDLRGSTRGNRI